MRAVSDVHVGSVGPTKIDLELKDMAEMNTATVFANGVETVSSQDENAA